MNNYKIELCADSLKSAIETLQTFIHDNAKAHGFWEEDRNNAECIALIHSELSEALESMRKNIDDKDEHCPEHLNVVIELADAVIRIFDLCGARGWDLASALIAKHNYNCDRPYKHEKAF